MIFPNFNCTQYKWQPTIYHVSDKDTKQSLLGKCRDHRYTSEDNVLDAHLNVPGPEQQAHIHICRITNMVHRYWSKFSHVPRDIFQRHTALM